jgi:predicted dienelactone hydrolase
MSFRRAHLTAWLLPFVVGACVENTPAPSDPSDALVRAADAQSGADVRVVERDAAQQGDASTADAAPQPSDAAPQPSDAAPQPADAAPQPSAAAPQPGDAAPQPADAAPQPGDAPDPGADGPQRTNRVEVALEAPGGGIVPRQVAVRIYTPQGDAPAPLVVINHAFQTNGADYDDYGQRLASHGFVVLIPTWDGGFNLRTHVELAQDHAWLLDWALAANDEDGGPLSGRIDAAHIGSMGHSRGGKQAIFAGILDDRVDAVLGLDPVDSAPPFGGGPDTYPSLTPERMGELNVPTAFIGAGRGGEGFMPCAPVADNYAAYYAAAQSPSAQYLLPEAGHLDFMANCGLACFGCVSGDDREFAHSFGLRTTVAFFARHLRDDARYDAYLSPPGLPEGIDYEAK